MGSYLRVTVHLSETTPVDWQFCNRVDISTSQVELVQWPNSITECATSVASTRDVSVGMSLASGTPLPGEVLTYGLNYFNGGNSPATGIIVTDTLSSGMSYEPTSGGVDTHGWTRQVSENQVVWTCVPK